MTKRNIQVLIMARNKEKQEREREFQRLKSLFPNGVLSMPDPRKKTKQLKAKLKKRASIRNIFKKYHTPLTDKTFVLIKEFENSLMDVDVQFEIIDRESLRRDKDRIQKIEKQIAELEDQYLKNKLLEILSHKKNFKLPNLNQERNAVISRCVVLAQHLLTTNTVQKKEPHLYPLLAELIEYIKPGLFTLDEEGLNATYIRAFNKYIKK